MIIPIGDHTVAVENETDLRTVVSANNDTYYVHLANDITLTSLFGITIHADRASLVIDGEYPQNSGIFHTLTDVASTSAVATLSIRSESSIKMIFQNMTIYGRNYYGVPCIFETPNTSNLELTYNNVNYMGSQMTYNHKGLTRYIDCNISITQIPDGSQMQEVGEVNRVEIGGKTSIYHASTDTLYSVFWFHDENSTSSLTILPDADVDIVSENNYFMFNLDGPIIPIYLVPVNYTVQSGASLKLTVNEGISLDQSHSVNLFLVEENASFHYIQTENNGTTASLYINSLLTMSRARFYMQAENGTQPLLSFVSGSQSGLTVDNPLNFALYSPNAAALFSTGETQFSFRGGQLNTWISATTPVEDAGGFDDSSSSKWFRKDYELPLEIVGSFTETSTSATGNLEPEDMPYPPLSDLRLDTARVLSIGDWPIIVTQAVDDGSPITGWTEPSANVRALYIISGTDYAIDGVADNTGAFSIDTSLEIPPEIPAGTEVNIWANISFLIKNVKTTVMEANDLFIDSAPSEIVFITSPLSTNPILLPRGLPEIPVIIKDLRTGSSSTQWELLAYITEPLQTEDGDILPDAVVFVEVEGAVPAPLSDEPIAVFTGGPGVETTNVTWPEREGILVQVTVPMRTGMKYTTHVIWDLRII